MCYKPTEDFADGDIELLADSVHPADMDGHEDWDEEAVMLAIDRDEQAALELLDEMDDFVARNGFYVDPLWY